MDLLGEDLSGLQVMIYYFFMEKKLVYAAVLRLLYLQMALLNLIIIFFNLVLSLVQFQVLLSQTVLWEAWEICLVCQEVQESLEECTLLPKR